MKKGWPHKWWRSKPIGEWTIADIAEFSRQIEKTDANYREIQAVLQRLRMYMNKGK